ncbi:ribose-5-phosphate isomerase [Enterococcus villorum]|jgi:hypothetical protein|uniref:Ribose-5-phosphate isomerase n=2 Tax=Enterococcus villorum TaxID=112904 RepID=A0A1V8YQZ0_9ENTE|nr:DUF1827 family protein [Enterococcus villorum]EOH89535.1 hypothetical protein UAO_01473 [Enterococcus villorum ATCC 700913]EOW76013.1 hypothetical protein I591_01313 [Enterococcus villorum ATCC 700913]OQO70890.1 ribose-5-phosphate isomerase [Enterococcus villorum]OQO75014.1 ribose-5-phosphate isomerase [Enterococcus villorum]GEL91679.1 hypothetical protein EVI01_10160 [Enterococcus villorum]
MKFVNVTNSHSRLVLNQLENTDANMVKVYTAGNTMVIYTEAPQHNEILLINEKRKIQPKEIEEVKKYFLNKIHDALYHEEEIQVIELADLVEISIPKHYPNAKVAM